MTEWNVMSCQTYYMAAAAAYILVNAGPDIYQRGRRTYVTSDCRVPLHNETQVAN